MCWKKHVMQVSPNVIRGIFYMCLASFFFSFMGGFAKLLGKSYSPLHITFFRNTIGLVPLIYSLYRRPAHTDNPKPFLLAFRGIAGTFVLFTLFYNLANLPLGEAVTYVQASTFFIAIFSYWFLREKLSKRGWLAAKKSCYIKTSGNTFLSTGRL